MTVAGLLLGYVRQTLARVLTLSTAMGYGVLQTYDSSWRSKVSACVCACLPV